MKIAHVCLGLCSLFMTYQSATAAEIRRSFDLEASNFIDYENNETPPVSNVNFAFTLTWNDATDNVGSSSGLVITENSLGFPAKFSYNLANDLLIVGSDPDLYGFSTTLNQFGFPVADATGQNPFSNLFAYEGADGAFYQSFDVKVTASSLSTVPLPASAPMFGTALLALAGMAYAAKRKKASATA